MDLFALHFLIERGPELQRETFHRLALTWILWQRRCFNYRFPLRYDNLLRDTEHMQFVVLLVELPSL